MSYLFDMSDPDEADEYDMIVQNCEDFFPLCLDAAFYGNESRFVNHSCEPNLKSYNLITDIEGYTYHKIGLFTMKALQAG